MTVLHSLIIVLCIQFSEASPFGGWGPGEGFGHLGRRPPPDNPNANFGFDYFGVTRGRFNYSAVVMSHKEPRSMRDPMFVAVAAKIVPFPGPITGTAVPFPGTSVPFTGTYQHAGSRKLPRKFRKNKSEIQAQLRNSKILRKGKSLPLQKFKPGPPKKSVTKSPRTKAPKRRVKPPKKFAQPSRRARARLELTANDLWRLNRSSHKFTQTFGRKGRRTDNQSRASRKKQTNHRRTDKFRKQSNQRAFRKQKGSFKGKG